MIPSREKVPSTISIPSGWLEQAPTQGMSTAHGHSSHRVLESVVWCLWHATGNGWGSGTNPCPHLTFLGPRCSATNSLGLEPLLSFAINNTSSGKHSPLPSKTGGRWERRAFQSGRDGLPVKFTPLWPRLKIISSQSLRTRGKVNHDYPQINHRPNWSLIPQW